MSAFFQKIVAFFVAVLAFFGININVEKHDVDVRGDGYAYSIDFEDREIEIEFPANPTTGYVLVKMVMDNDAWYVVRNTRGVTGFVGPGSKPVPLSDKEVAAMGFDTNKVSIELNFKVGDRVKISGGAMEGFTGTVKAIDTEEKTVDVSVSMFGRETPATVELSQVSLDED